MYLCEPELWVDIATNECKLSYRKLTIIQLWKYLYCTFFCSLQSQVSRMVVHSPTALMISSRARRLYYGQSTGAFGLMKERAAE